MLTRRAVVASGLAFSAITAVRADERMGYFPSTVHEQIKSDPAGSIAAVYAAERQRFLNALGSSFSAEIEEHIKLGFCAVLAYDLIPYGSEGGDAGLPLGDLVLRPSMDCDNYVALTWRLFNALVPAPTTSMFAVGWDGGPIGNHAQICSHKSADAQGNGGGDWLVDPTIGLVLCGHGWDWVARGMPCNMVYAKDFFWRTPGQIDQFHGDVVNAIASGACRPSHILYYAKTLAKFLAPGPSSNWLTPRAA